jgi:hypothetical protein
MGFATAFWSALQGEVSGEALRAYRCAGLQVLDLESALAAAGARDPGAAWQTPDHVRHALLFHWVAGGLLSVANHLLDADAAAEPATRGYLPRLTFNQAKALYTQVPEYLRRGFEALANPAYNPDCPLPVELGPRLTGDGPFPPTFLRGLMAAVEALDAHADLRLTTLTADLGRTPAGGGGARSADRQTLARLRQARAAAGSRAKWGLAKAAGAAGGGSKTAQAEALSYLWDALADLFLLGQTLALPDLLPPLTGGAPARRRGRTRGRRISQRGEDRWVVSDPAARRALQHTAFGEREIALFWRERNWRLSDREADTLAEIRWLREQNRIEAVGLWAVAPFDTVYCAAEPVSVQGHRVPRDHEFRYDLATIGGRVVIAYPHFEPVHAYGDKPCEGGPLRQSDAEARR